MKSVRKIPMLVETVTLVVALTGGSLLTAMTMSQFLENKRKSNEGNKL